MADQIFTKLCTLKSPLVLNTHTDFDDEPSISFTDKNSFVWKYFRRRTLKVWRQYRL